MITDEYRKVLQSVINSNGNNCNANNQCNNNCPAKKVCAGLSPSERVVQYKKLLNTPILATEGSY